VSIGVLRNRSLRRGRLRPDLALALHGLRRSRRMAERPAPAHTPGPAESTLARLDPAHAGEGVPPFVDDCCGATLRRFGSTALHLCYVLSARSILSTTIARRCGPRGRPPRPARGRRGRHRDDGASLFPATAAHLSGAPQSRSWRPTRPVMPRRDRRRRRARSLNCPPSSTTYPTDDPQQHNICGPVMAGQHYIV